MESDGRSPRRSRREILGRGGDGRERMDDGHEDGGLIELPTEILHSIMLHVSTDLRDHFNAVAAVRTLRRVAIDGVLLRDIDLFTMQFPPIENDMHCSPINTDLEDNPLNNRRRSIMNFHLLCHHRGNISATFLQGCSEFYYCGDLENDLAMIRRAALRGYELASYVYAMLRRILNPNEEIDLELINPNRDLVRRMRRRLENCSHYYWGPRLMPGLYWDRCLAFDSSIIRRCHCAWNNRGWPEHLESVKDPWMCDTCFYAIHVVGFITFIPHRVMQWPME